MTEPGKMSLIRSQQAMTMARKMALTPELVAQAHRVVDEPGPDGEFVPYTDEEYRAAVAAILAGHPSGQDAWLFAYGSLI